MTSRGPTSGRAKADKVPRLYGWSLVVDVTNAQGLGSAGCRLPVLCCCELMSTPTGWQGRAY